MRTQISCGLYTGVAAAEELVPYLQRVSNTFQFRLRLKNWCRICKQSATPSNSSSSSSHWLHYCPFPFPFVQRYICFSPLLLIGHMYIANNFIATTGLMWTLESGISLEKVSCTYNRSSGRNNNSKSIGRPKKFGKLLSILLSLIIFSCLTDSPNQSNDLIIFIHTVEPVHS